MRNLIAIMKRKTAKEIAQNKVAELLKEFVEIYNCYPNFQYNREDWQKHYDIANKIIETYKLYEKELNASKISTDVFISNVKDHISKLENIRDHGRIQ